MPVREPGSAHASSAQQLVPARGGAQRNGERRRASAAGGGGARALASWLGGCLAHVAQRPSGPAHAWPSKRTPGHFFYFYIFQNHFLHKYIFGFIIYRCCPCGSTPAKRKVRIREWGEEEHKSATN